MCGAPPAELRNYSSDLATPVNIIQKKIFKKKVLSAQVAVVILLLVVVIHPAHLEALAASRGGRRRQGLDQSRNLGVVKVQRSLRQEKRGETGKNRSKIARVKTTCILLSAIL